MWLLPFFVVSLDWALAFLRWGIAKDQRKATNVDVTSLFKYMCITFMTLSSHILRRPSTCLKQGWLLKNDPNKKRPFREHP